jgi:hypothetical protein
MFERAWHTARVLPDGTVLILGGIGADGKVGALWQECSNTAEWPMGVQTVCKREPPSISGSATNVCSELTVVFGLKRAGGRPQSPRLRSKMNRNRQRGQADEKVRCRCDRSE